MKRTERKVQVLFQWTQDTVEIFEQACIKWKAFNQRLSLHKETINQQVSTPDEFCYQIIMTTFTFHF